MLFSLIVFILYTGLPITIGLVITYFISQFLPYHWNKKWLIYIIVFFIAYSGSRQTIVDFVLNNL